MHYFLFLLVIASIAHHLLMAERADRDQNDDNHTTVDTLEQLPARHPNQAIFTDIQRISRQQLQHALADVSNADEGWELFVEDGDLKMYKLEREEEDGIVVDPLKAFYTIEGVTAREFIDMFFRPDIKQEWDDTIESCRLVERLGPDTVVLHQVHRRIWPTSTRESLFWSQRLNVSAHKGADAQDAWMVCNQSVDRDDVELSTSSAVRVKLTIAMLGQTVVKSPGKPLAELTREDVQCKITYVAQVHPGGWVPKIGVRQIYKKEYPKFVRTFSKYVQDRVHIRETPTPRF